MKKIVHYTFSTYKRKHILENWIADELLRIFSNICAEKGFEIICQNILLEHVHLLLGKRMSDSNEYVMKIIKGGSARRFFKKYPSNRYEFRKLWGRGYRAVSIKDEEHLKQVVAYIDNQKIDGMDKRIVPHWKPRRLVAGFQSKEK